MLEYIFDMICNNRKLRAIVPKLMVLNIKLKLKKTLSEYFMKNVFFYRFSLAAANSCDS